MNTTIDLRTCKPGQKLRTKHGTILTYVGPSNSRDYPHQIEYPDGSYGTRLDNGNVYANKRLPEDEDVVEIIPGVPKDGCYVCLEGIKHGNRFMSMHKTGDDPTKSARGETWYRILGYADTHEDGMKILYPVPGSADVALNLYLVKTMLKMDGVLDIDA